MVQRKVFSQLGIQADHLSIKTNLKKPSSLQFHQDHVKSPRGADLKKKKMKKSGKTTSSLRRHTPEPKTPSSLRSHIPEPKTPPLPKPRSCSANSTPNYMKSTSSSDARKEKSQVSSRTPHSVSSGRKNSKNSNPSNSKSGHNSSSLKLARIPSFKPARAAYKKCSQVVLCEDLDAQRATCSSTLKDSKFPCYLELSPGGTESQGTSAMKVCPYTYCSLNGHRHLPLPPLKCFLSAKRRSLKAQRSLKIGCLSPRRTKPSQEELISCEVPDENSDFTIEIYCKESGEAAMNHDPETTLCLNDALDEVKGSTEEEEEEGEDIHPASMEESMSDQPDFENSDMECERQGYSAVYIDEKSDVEAYGTEDEKACYAIQDGKSDLAENMLQQLFDEESVTSGAWLSDDDSLSSISCAETNFCEYIQVSDEQTEEAICKDYPTSHEENMINFPGDPESSNDSNGGENDTKPNLIDTNGPESADEGLIAQEEAENTEEQGNQAPGKTEKTKKQNVDVELPSLRKISRNKRQIEEEEGEESREFNPRGPNFLPLEADPGTERVDLKHQSLDERKNAEEWMVDYALRQAVSKLAPARRKKVALLVEAFETVSPIPKYRHSSKLFPQPSRSIQACS